MQSSLKKIQTSYHFERYLKKNDETTQRDKIKTDENVKEDEIGKTQRLNNS